ncbi:MAG: alpha/beta hydrolase [Aestuariivirga sp.]
MAKELSFIHRFEKGMSTATPLLLLHGTGGNEDDMLQLGRALAPDRALLSPRGKVLENGMPRFFRRLAEGVFDEQDLIARAHELADFIIAAGENYNISKPIAVGFSNGANIAAAVLLLRPEVLSGAILLRAMAPLAKPPAADLAQKRVLIVSGASDPIIPASNAKLLAAMLKAAHADLQHETLAAGHNLTQNDVTLATTWLNR